MTDKEKGELYEKQIGKLFLDNDFDVAFNGLNYGKKDNGIDLIANNNDTVCLIDLIKNTGV